MAMTGRHGELLHVRLCHAVKRQDVWLGPESFRATGAVAFAVEIRRPDAGGTVERLVGCGYCGAEVVLVVHCTSRTAALRRRWLLLVLLGGLLCVIGLLGLVLPIGDVSAGSPLLGLLAAVIVIGVVLVIGFFRLWHNEYGVRYPAGDAVHSAWP
jgi:hypothetical protein